MYLFLELTEIHAATSKHATKNAENTLKEMKKNEESAINFAKKNNKTDVENNSKSDGTVSEVTTTSEETEQSDMTVLKDDTQINHRELGSIDKSDTSITTEKQTDIESDNSSSLGNQLLVAHMN